MCSRAMCWGAENGRLARQFARSGIDRFSGISWTDIGGGLPVLDGSPALVHHDDAFATAVRLAPPNTR
ncbi:hypothetical protein ABZ547_21910 [Streptomyces sparsogenes]|uniref:hypothetical protein n=1 Tax=Streptomyces sparsogenes TaxID=67365 RepID=UPI0033D738E7